MKAKIFTEEEIKNIIIEYQTTKIGIETIALKYQTGKLKIKEILINNNIPFKVKGNVNTGSNSTIAAKEKYKKELTPKKGFNFIAICKTTGKIYKDYLNKSGALSEHIIKEHGIDIPNNHYKKKYLLENNKYWHELFFDLEEVPINTKRKCKYCEWKTDDIFNKTGCYENHLLDEHNITIAKFISDFPDEISFHSNYKKSIDKIKSFLHTDNYIICEICKEKFKSLTNTHMLNIHHISIDEYKMKYSNKLSSYKTFKINSDNMRLNNVNMIPTYESLPEKEIKNYIVSLGFPNAGKNRKLLKGKEIDILIEEKKVAVEFNGNKWHTEKFGKKSRSYHLDKTKGLLDLGYRTIQIFEDEWGLKEDIVKSKISHILGVSNLLKIGGRQCKVNLISKQVANTFLDRYHIQGEVNGDIYCGAYYNEILIAIMSFNKKRNMAANAQKIYDYELSRFATHVNYQVAGIASKLLKFFINNFNPKSIISFADRRWSSDIEHNLYDRLGFINDGYTPPNYWYYNNKIHRFKRFHKFGFGINGLKKKGMYIQGMSEWECMQYHGWDRIWDCGLIRYVWTKPIK